MDPEQFFAMGFDETRRMSLAPQGRLLADSASRIVLFIACDAPKAAMPIARID
jgi:hypothetical protein